MIKHGVIIRDLLYQLIMLQLNLIWCSIVLISSSPFHMVHHGQDSTIVAFDVKVSNVEDCLCAECRRTFVSEMRNSLLMSGQTGRHQVQILP